MERHHSRILFWRKERKMRGDYYNKRVLYDKRKREHSNTRKRQARKARSARGIGSVESKGKNQGKEQPIRGLL